MASKKKTADLVNEAEKVLDSYSAKNACERSEGEQVREWEGRQRRALAAAKALNNIHDVRLIMNNPSSEAVQVTAAKIVLELSRAKEKAATPEFDHFQAYEFCDEMWRKHGGDKSYYLQGERKLQKLPGGMAGQAAEYVKFLYQMKDPQTDQLVFPGARAFIERYCTINNKNTGRRQPFRANRLQRLALRRYEECRLQLRHFGVQTISLKPRQMGKTQLDCRLLGCNALIHENWLQYFMAHVKDESKDSGVLGNAFDICADFFRQIPFAPRIEGSGSFQTGLLLDKARWGSKIIFFSAGAREPGSGLTLHGGANDELGKYPPGTAESAMRSCNQALQKSMTTLQLIGGTAKEEGEYLRVQWDRALSGTSEFMPIFLPVFLHEEYRIPLPNWKDYKLQDEIREYAETHPEIHQYLVDKVDPESAGKNPQQDYLEFLEWVRLKVAADCQGSYVIFDQEYPTRPEVAFVESGDCFFDNHLLRQGKKKTSAPEMLGHFHGLEFESREKLIFEPSRTGFEDSRKGHHIWIKPHCGHCGIPLQDLRGNQIEDEYIFGVDPVIGSISPTGDWSVIMVFSRRLEEFVAMFRDRISPDELLNRLKEMMLYYRGKNPNIAIEAWRNDGGLSKELGELYKDGRTRTLYNFRLYHMVNWRKGRPEVDPNRPHYTEAGNQDFSTKEPLFKQFREYLHGLIRDERRSVSNPLLIEEAQSFIRFQTRTGKWKLDHKSGKKNDVLVAAALCIEAHKSPEFPTRYEELNRKNMILPAPPAPVEGAYESVFRKCLEGNNRGDSDFDFEDGSPPMP